MKLAIFAFTRKGCDIARQCQQALGYEETRMFTMEKFGQPDFECYQPPLARFTGPVFQWADTIVFVGSTGMAIRAIAPWVRDKKTDPAVLSVDEGGHFVISLLSGHIGGANAETRFLAGCLGAVSVVTTATDVNGRFSVDEWAARNGLWIRDMAAAKAVAARILEADVPMVCDFPIASGLPGGVVPADRGEIGIYIGIYDKKPFKTTLQLIPKVVQLGIGCRRGTGEEAIERAVSTVAQRHGIRPEAFCGVASIDLKADEAGLLSYCAGRKLDVQFYTAEQLRNVPGDFPASSFVSGVTGVDNVCQRAAMLGAERCIVEKTAMDGVTVAMALRKWEAVF